VFWADELAARVTGPQVVNDSKTPSGTIHVGSLRGPVLLDVIVRALRDSGLPVEMRYGIDDLDPMDAQALLTPDAVERSMGVPLAHVPDPLADGHASYARHFAGLFIATFSGLGIRPGDELEVVPGGIRTGSATLRLRPALARAMRVEVGP